MDDLGKTWGCVVCINQTGCCVIGTDRCKEKLHLICDDCAQRLLTFQEGRKTSNCPVCRQVGPLSYVDVPSDAIDAWDRMNLAQASDATLVDAVVSDNGHCSHFFHRNQWITELDVTPPPEEQEEIQEFDMMEDMFQDGQGMGDLIQEDEWRVEAQRDRSYEYLPEPDEELIPVNNGVLVEVVGESLQSDEHKVPSAP